MGLRQPFEDEQQELLSCIMKMKDYGDCAPNENDLEIDFWYELYYN
jgi:hypothetical protein